MRSARALGEPGLPPQVSNIRNNKQKLILLSKKNLAWHGSEISNSGESLVRSVMDSLWLIDGHHDVFTSRNYPIPACFRSYTGYNLPELSSVQHARNVGLMVQCEECEMWRLIYRRQKLPARLRTKLETILVDYTFTCGANLQELELPDEMSEVCVRDVPCYDPLEKLYYSMKYDPICIYCCATEDLTIADGCYPQCVQCKDKTAMRKRVEFFIAVMYV